jgi:16S rRNA (uracil1498-N3)-methyltransferase
MRLHRFYISPDTRELDHSFWLHDPGLLNQWLRVLRFREGQEVVLFDGKTTERLYKITHIEQGGVHLELVTEFERKLPTRHVYLFWALLKKDKNDWVLQKATELGVTNFVPLLAERSEKTGFNLERSQKIVTEAAEQCGRSDIPHVREPISLEEVLKEYASDVQLLVCDEREQADLKLVDKPVGVLIGPEGGWTEGEIEQCKQAGVGALHLGHLTLRAETAAIVAAAALLV